MLDTIVDLVTSLEFRRGLLAAAALLAVGAILFALRHRPGPLPVGGLGLAIAGAAALTGTPLVEIRILAGLALLAVAGVAAFPAPRATAAAAAVLALPGAWLVVTGIDHPGPRWVTWLVFSSIVVTAPLLARVDEVLVRPALAPLLVAVAAGAVLLTVPDTEEILVLVPVTAGAALLGWPLGVARLGRAGAFASTGLLMAVILWDGRGRTTAVIGAVATLAVPALSGLWTVLRSRIGRPLCRPWVLVAIHLGAALVAARVAGLARTVTTASVIAAIGTGAAAGFLRMTRVWR